MDFVICLDSGKPDKMILEMVSIDGEMNINSLFTTKKPDAYLENKSYVLTGSEYNGPIFDSLDENLQDKILGYLNALGINEDLALFIESSSLEHESKLYNQWLKNFEKFL